ncbi:MAG: hypothetical protein HQK62_01750 [Desulfamplus sp.]|nr:hypothetical protein [Desulfamplus sp.]MBF0257555.1 hypothetical protein [Desulfamplus sp.]
MKEKAKYTCNEYREEMILAALRQRLANADLSLEEKKALIKEIEKIEKEMGF